MCLGCHYIFKGNGMEFSPLLSATWRSASVLTEFVMVWSLHLYGAGSHVNKLTARASQK